MKQKKLKKVDGSKRRGSQSIKKTKGKKAHDFTGRNIDKDTAKRGMEIEDGTVKLKNIIFSGIALGGIFLIILGIQDNGLKFEGLGISISCSLVGIILVVISIIGIIRNHPKIDISTEK